MERREEAVDKREQLEGTGVVYASEAYEKDRQTLPEICKQSCKAYLQWDL